MAAAAKAGCQCEVTKSEVIITNIQAPAAAPGTRRHLSAAEGIMVGVSILVPNLEAGTLLVQSGALSKEGINKELDKLQVERVTSVSSPALPSSASNGNNSSEAAASSSPASSGSKEKSSRAGDIVGGVLGVLVVVVLSGLAFYRWRKTKRSNRVFGARGPVNSGKLQLDFARPCHKQPWSELIEFKMDPCTSHFFYRLRLSRSRWVPIGTRVG